MGKFSVLYNEIEEYRVWDGGSEKELPAFYIDFNLNQVIDAITEGCEPKVKALFYDMPETLEVQEYRRGIYTDMKQEAVRSAFEEFMAQMKYRDECIVNQEKVESQLQKNVWHLCEVSAYLTAVKNLFQSLSTVEAGSEGLQRLLVELRKSEESEAFQRLYQKVAVLVEELKSFRVLLHYENDRLEVAEGTGVGTYSEMLVKCELQYDRKLISPFVDSPELVGLEESIIRIFMKKHKTFFANLEKFSAEENSSAQGNQYAEEVYLQLYKEVPYYLLAFGFQGKMSRKGFAFTEPVVSEGNLTALGLYDLALAYVASEEGKSVVSNDITLFAQESFFVLTGPNQGGKTTFARSLGQLIYFTKMGLDVPAVSASVPYFAHLLSHFSVEESVESGRGKLMEELVRLKPMMESDVTNAFVVLNELFTTAANYDACVMGQRVLAKFIEKNCKGIYVTHLKELVDTDLSIVSLRAMINEENKQTYKIERREPRDIAGANIQVEKYNLTYEKIKERFV